MTTELLGLPVVGFVYWLAVRFCFRRWGANRLDRSRVMRGDALVVKPTYSATLAVTVDARPDCIWPWLLQLGYRRGGLYSYDWLDRFFGYLDRPSAETVLAEFQHLQAGDEIPMGRGFGFPVRVVEPGRSLVLGGESDGTQWSWQFGLYPLDGTHTRLVSRNTARTPKTIPAWVFKRILEPAAFVMTRRMLLGLKRRAETLAKAHRDRSPTAA